LIIFQDRGGGANGDDRGQRAFSGVDGSCFSVLEGELNQRITRKRIAKVLEIVGAKDDLGNWLSTVKRLNPPPPEPIVVDGAFKVPGLRNVELTAPYFRNGGQLDLPAVLEFYNHGGDSHEEMKTLDGIFIEPMPFLNLSTEERQALEAFLVSLTDERVRFQQAPFDHPQLFVPNGPGAPRTIMPGDQLAEVPPVGRFGGPPQKRFLEP
jgi:hypothetical protein